ncbi:SYT6 [Mytilus edulis]|uniref:SYT6 n=1 Tax=Mytilus edulis TaxID=6550 RepID=A0A8S3QXT5_MYTED|nr:SYT6 [Mytilus edulis]
MGICLNRLTYKSLDDDTILSARIPVIKLMDVHLSKESRTVQPRSSTTSRGSISTMSRGSVRSDPFTEDTSSISARSDTSVDSFVFDPSVGVIRPDLYPRKDAVLQQSSLDQCQGRLHIRLKYDFRTSDVVIHLIEAQELCLPESREAEVSFGDPYVRICMSPEVDERIRQSSVKRKTCNPFFNEYFKFPVTFDDVRDKQIVFLIYDYDKFSRHKCIGEVQVDLGKIDVSNSVEMWCDIQKYQKSNTTESYKLMKAKDLKLTGDPYIRVALIVDGKKIKRKKTSVKKGTTAPVWNEALSFNVPAEVLPKVNLEITVIDHDLIVGKCVLGSSREGHEGKHWNEMLTNPHKSMAMWQALHRQ